MESEPDNRTADLGESWSAAAEAIFKYVSQVDKLPVTPELGLDEIAARLRAEFDFKAPRTPADAIASAAKLLTEGQTHTPNRNYYGLFNPDVLPVSIAADALTAAFNPQLATVHHSPAAIAMEAHVLGVFQRLLGHDPGSCIATFTTAGSEANHSGVLCALTAAFPDFAEHGAANRPVFYVSAEAHHSFVKIAHAVGIGRSAVREVPANASLSMDPEALSRQIQEDHALGASPFLVIGTAGTTAAGAIDPLPEIAAICRREGLWFHADAAWGGAALLSPKLAPHLAGIELADSVTFDAHKWLSIPMGAGMFLCRRRETVLRTFGVQTSYMPIAESTPDPFVSGLQWSRRFIGLKLFLTMATLGQEGYAGLIEHQAAMGDLLKRRLSESGWIVANHTPFPLANFTHLDIEGGKTSVARVLECLNLRRRVWISDVRLSTGAIVLRACITNYRTDETDIETLLAELQFALHTR